MTRITKKRITKTSHKRRTIKKNYRGSGIKAFFGKIRDRFRRNKTQQTVKKSGRIRRFFRNIFTRKKKPGATVDTPQPGTGVVPPPPQPGTGVVPPSSQPEAVVVAPPSSQPEAVVAAAPPSSQPEAVVAAAPPQPEAAIVPSSPQPEASAAPPPTQPEAVVPIAPPSYSNAIYTKQKIIQNYKDILDEDLENQEKTLKEKEELIKLLSIHKKLKYNSDTELNKIKKENYQKELSELSELATKIRRNIVVLERERGDITLQKRDIYNNTYKVELEDLFPEKVDKIKLNLEKNAQLDDKLSKLEKYEYINHHPDTAHQQFMLNVNNIFYQNYKPKYINSRNSGLNSIGVPLKDLEQIPGYLKLKEIRSALNDKKISESKQAIRILSKFTEDMERPFDEEDIRSIYSISDPRSVASLKNAIDNIPEKISAFLKEEKLKQYPKLFIGNGYNNRNKSSNYLSFVKNLKFLLSVFKLAQQRFFTNSIYYQINNINNSNLIINDNIKKLITPRKKAFIKSVTSILLNNYADIYKLSTGDINDTNIIQLLINYGVIHEYVTELPTNKQNLEKIRTKLENKFREFSTVIESVKKMTNDVINNTEKTELLKKLELLKSIISKMDSYLNSKTI